MDKGNGHVGIDAKAHRKTKAAAVCEGNWFNTKKRAPMR